MRLADGDDDDDVYLAGISKQWDHQIVLCFDYMHCGAIGCGTIFIFVMS